MPTSSLMRAVGDRTVRRGSTPWATPSRGRGGARATRGIMTGHYPRRRDTPPGKRAIVMAACRPGWRFGVILAQEDERWIVTMGGYLGDHPPIDEAGYIEFARSLPKSEIFEVIKDAE